MGRMYFDTVAPAKEAPPRRGVRGDDCCVLFVLVMMKWQPWEGESWDYHDVIQQC